jgi:competence protein ComEC
LPGGGLPLDRPGSLRRIGAGGGSSVDGGGPVGPSPARRPGALAARNEVLAGLLVLGLLLVAGGAAASVRATAVRGGVLVGWVGRPGRVEVAGAVAEEPRRLRYGGRWVVLTVDRVRLGGRTQTTRERAGVVLGRGGGEERLGVGDRLRVRASVANARWGDALGRRPPVVLRHPVIEERAPPPGAVGGAALRVSEAVRDAARRQAVASLAPERAGLLVGMALGDTSLLPAELERDFRAAGLTHLMALTSSHGLKPCDSRFTLPLPQRGHQRRAAGLRPTGSDGSPRTRQAAPAGLAG